MNKIVEGCHCHLKGDIEKKDLFVEKLGNGNALCSWPAKNGRKHATYKIEDLIWVPNKAGVFKLGR